MIENSDTIIALLSEIKDRLNQSQPEKITLNVEEVAAVFGKSKASGFSIVKNPDFPAPIAAQGICRCWLREDVLKWAKRQKLLQGTSI